ncbi:MAG TPA: choice-of-anchor tandem repeat NxxGxxAF-containing protein [Phycisphaerales bacterium]|nr:choice-of-anchor tandem repeat NxxGxxAF-containing protein [Phycisphaerales bacterium]
MTNTLAAALGVLASAGVAAAQPVFEIIHVAGQQASGLPAGCNYVFPAIPGLDSGGNAMFFTALGGTGVTTENNRAIFGRGVGLAPNLLVRMGDAIPALPGVRWGEINNGHTEALGGGAGGRLAVLSYLVGDGVTAANGSALFLGLPENLAVVARAGAQAPGAPAGALYGDLPPSIVNGVYTVRHRNGRIVFECPLVGSVPSGTRAVFAGTPGAISLVARRAAQAPGAPVGVNYSTFAGPVTNAAGFVAFSAVLSGTGVTIANDGAIFAGTPGSVVMIAREGNAAPPAPGMAGLTTSGIGGFWINDAGTLTFTATLAGPGITTENDSAAFIIPGGGGTPTVIREGDAAPGLPGLTHGTISVVIPSGGGRVLMTSQLAGPGVTTTNNRAIWVGTPGNFSLVMRSGDPAPGLPGVSPTAFLDVCLSPAGHIAFLTTLTGTGVTSTNNTALWGRTSAGQVTLLARKGVPFEFAPGQTITPDAILLNSLTGGEDGKPAAVNDDNQVAFLLYVSPTAAAVGVLAHVDAVPPPPCGTADFNGDGDTGTDQDIEAFFACIGGHCCPTCFEGGSDFNADGDAATDQDIEAFFRVLGGHAC